MTISICVPTRGRPGKFAEMLASAKETAEGSIEVCAWMDDDDPTRKKYPKDPIVRYGSGPRENIGGLPMMSNLWNHAWGMATGDIAMLGGDDSIFMTPGWDTAVEAEFAKVPDGILMVYTDTGEVNDHNNHEPCNPFVSRRWIDTVGYFTPPDYQGWFSDVWVWCLAAEVGRAVFLPDVLVDHVRKKGSDQTYRDGEAARKAVGGWQEMKRRFYSPLEVLKRDEQVEKLRAVMEPIPPLVPKPEPKWYKQSLARPQRNLDTLVVVHCYDGDREQVLNALPLYLHHGCPVLILSPENAPVHIDHPRVECRSAGLQGYFGQDSLDRERLHMEILLEYPYNHFLMNDSDSMCLSPKIPDYLYTVEAENTFYSNEVREGRPHKSPYPKIALQAPFFLSRKTIERLLAVADKEEVKAHPITPFIDWYMLALSCEAGIPHRSFPDGKSFPAWRYGAIPETTVTPDGAPRSPTVATITGEVERGGVDGASLMESAVLHGTVFVHAVKHKDVLARLVGAYNLRTANSSTYPRTVFPTRRNPRWVKGYSDAVSGANPENDGGTDGHYLLGFEVGLEVRRKM